MKTVAWYAKQYVKKYGMHVLPLKEKQKLPLLDDWGNKCISDPEAAAAYFTERPNLNIGFSLGLSGYCSLDIDCEKSFKIILEDFGKDYAELDQYPTIQGSAKGKRVIFKVPDGVDLPYAKLNWSVESVEKKHYTIFELRAASDGKHRFDCLPPSVHPDTKEPYKWIVQPPKSNEAWPQPPEWLLAIWKSWATFKPQMVDSCPWIVKPEYKQPPKRPQQQSGDTIDISGMFCDVHDLPMVLEQYGYKRIGKRYLSPHSTTNLPGVIPFEDGRACYIHHASDPLCSNDTGHPVNAYDLFCYYECDDDRSKAFKAAADLLGVELKTKRPITTPAPQTQTALAPTKQPQEDTGRPFKAVGYNGASYYYLPRGTEQVTEIRRSGHTSPSELMALAPLEWWAAFYPKKDNVDWQGAGNDLMRACEKAGIYSHDRERGRGAWYDAGRSVLHLGDKLLINGVASSIHDTDTKFIYTKQAPLEFGAQAVPASDAQGQNIADLVGGLNWASESHARLLAGWCFLSPICGALTWRPHVWLTAQRGAGKTWVQDHIINPLIGPAAMMVQGSTTEAGIRQRLKQDARPIVFDEAESEDQHSQKRMQTVIELARQSSSDSTAEIVKGTAGGQGMAFRMRSMFLLGSINVALSHAADESRFSVLSLATPSKTAGEIDRFESFSKTVDNTLTDEACASIRARAYALMPVIRHNSKALGRAVAELLGSQRLGDQVGTLLAGDYCLRHSDELTIEKAREWVHDMDFSEAKEAEQVSDEQRCISAILEHQLRFDSDRGMITRSIAELISIASGGTAEHSLTSVEVNSLLQRHGLKVENNLLLVANQHKELAKILKDTAWNSGWRRVLARINGAKSVETIPRFAGIRSRALSVPINEIL